MLVVNENNDNPTCSLPGSELIRNVVVIGPNLIGHYVVPPGQFILNLDDTVIETSWLSTSEYFKCDRSFVERFFFQLYDRMEYDGNTG